MQPSGRFPDIAGKKLVQMEGKYIPFFLKALGHSHYRVRQRAVEALGMLRDIAKEVVPQLINVALEDPAAYVKQAAIRALRKIGGTEEAISQFTNVLFGPDQSLRSAASNALLYIGANVRELVPQLVENLSKPDIQTRRIAASVLHRLGQQVAEDAIPQLIDAVFNDSDSLVYTDSIHALNKIGAEKVTKIVLPRFKSALSSLDVKVRQRAALAFCYMSKHVEGAALPLTELTEVALHDPDETTRRYASGALGNIAFFLPIESELLSSSDAKVRQRAAMALYYMGSRAKAAAPQLVEAMLNDTDATVRSSSAKALGLMWKGAPNDKIVNALVHALSDLDASVRWSAAQALSNAKDNAKEAIFHLTGALSDPDARVRDRAADALNKIGKEAVPYLLTELSNSDVGIRRRVAEAFFHIGAKAAGEAAPQLAAVLNSDSDVQVRFRIVCVLKEMPPNTIKGILNPLIEAGLRETDAEVSRVMSYIWKTLGRAEAREVLPKVMPALSDSDVLVCLNALGFLSFIGAHDKKVIPPLVAKLSDSDVLVRRRAASALWNFFQPLPRKDFNTAIEMVPQVPHLAAALSDSDQGVREYVALTLCSMGSNANEALPQLENAISHLPTDYIRDRVQSTVDFLKKERIRSTQ